MSIFWVSVLSCTAALFMAATVEIVSLDVSMANAAYSPEQRHH
jgi:hypothetical protein